MNPTLAMSSGRLGQFLLPIIKPSTFKRIPTPYLLLNARTFLTEAHQCDEAWEKVLAQTQSLVPDNYERYSISLLDKSHRGYPNTTVELDTLAHKFQDVEDLAALDIFEPLLRAVRVSPQAANFHWGTSHAIVRGYLDMNLSSRLTDRLLAPKTEYGVFLDGYSAAFLLNDTISKEDWTRGGKIAEDLMQQETFFSSLLRRMCMLSAWKHFQTGGVDERQANWEAEEEERVAEESKEEEKLEYYHFLPNGYNDDLFDLKRPLDLAGKTAMMVGFEEGGDVGASFMLFGSALRGEEALRKTLVDLNAFDRKVATSIVDSVSARFAENADVGELTGKLQTSSIDIEAELTSLIESEVKTGVDEFRGGYEALMKGWTEERRVLTEAEHWKNQEKEIRRLAREQIAALEKQEEVLTYFENELKVELMADMAMKKTKEKETKLSPFERYVKRLHPDLVDHKKRLGKTWLPVECRKSKRGTEGADELYHWADYYKRPWWSF